MHKPLRKIAPRGLHVLVALQGLTRSAAVSQKNPLQINGVEELPAVQLFLGTDPSSGALKSLAIPRFAVAYSVSCVQ
jgi:hypothetical protein